MQFLFSALAGYGDIKAKADLDQFFAMVERPRGIHLCGNPDREKTVEKAFDQIRRISRRMREHFRLSP